MHQDKLVTLIKNNDRDTLEKIYQENFHKVLSYILKNSGTPQQAKDIYQEAFIAMWRNIKRENSSGRLRRVESLRDWRRSGVLLHLPSMTLANAKN